MNKNRKVMFGVGVIIAFCTLAYPSAGQWHALETIGQATPRHESGLVIFSGNLYLIGGRGVKPVEVLDLETNEWTQKQPTPIEMHHITPVVVGDKIYVVGGLTGGYPKEQPIGQVYVYDPVTDQWNTIFEIPKERQRGAGGVVVDGDNIYLVNGITYGHTSGTNAMMDVYHVSSNTWESLPDVPHIRDHSTAAIVNHKLYALGGRNTSHHEEGNFMAFFQAVVTEVDVYDLKSGQWSTLSTELPIPSAGAGIAAWKKGLIYVGGETGDNPARNEAYYLDARKESWEALPKLNQGRHGTNAAIVDDKLYIGAGSGNRGGGPELNSVEVLGLKK
ncbi:galactose oxidase [Reichenbachiella agarivorans]|uniref:Galactose oxidase n=1 Tax=Reichenbachiella agarivorans TaxID=2979464 RepID=A0ABY6CPN2_9BACT|nr:kelch repeat-containing protein [Reichenbachiella agarivorans]UXP31990.1 galactose oxidase [Reichenbachiella agarivorans]